MRKNILVFVLACLGSTACYEDKTTFATDRIDDIVLSDAETTAIYSGYLEQIDFAPELTQGDKVLEGDFSYKWEINDIPNGNEFETIGTEKELHATLVNAISTRPYLLKLTVRDQANDLEYIFWWDLYVQSAFLDGLVVCDTEDGTTSDLTLILNDKLTINYAGKEEKIFRKIVETATGEPYPALLGSMTPMLKGYHFSPTHYLWAIDQNGAPARFNCQDYSYATGSDVILYSFEGQKFLKFLSTSTSGSNQSLFSAMTTHGNYAFQSVNADTFAWLNTSMSSYTIKDNIVALRSYAKSGICTAAWLDETTNRIIIADTNWQGYLLCTPLEGSGAYDATDIGDKSVIAGGMTYSESIPALLFKDNPTGEYAIYTITPYEAEVGHYEDPDDWDSPWIVDKPEVPCGPRAKIDIPAEGKTLLDNATSTTFCTMQAILYVATANEIRAINFSTGTAVVSDVKFTPQEGEKITSIKLYQQGQYVYSSAMCYDPGTIDVPRPLLDLTNQAVIVTTQKSDTQGIVYVVPMRQIGTGNLDSENAMRYDGFGKIIDVATTGY